MQQHLRNGQKVTAREIRQLLADAREKTIPYTRTREAYDDITSMGTPYREPAAEIRSLRAMNDGELAEAILALFSARSGEVA